MARFDLLPTVKTWQVGVPDQVRIQQSLRTSTVYHRKWSSSVSAPSSASGAVGTVVARGVSRTRTPPPGRCSPNGRLPRRPGRPASSAPSFASLFSSRMGIRQLPSGASQVRFQHHRTSYVATYPDTRAGRGGRTAASSRRAERPARRARHRRHRPPATHGAGPRLATGNNP
jgi:hypothetical protein